ncbi:unnamed protein product, partial [marine sediment metagenome]
MTREQKLRRLHNKENLVVHVTAPSDRVGPGSV